MTDQVPRRASEGASWFKTPLIALAIIGVCAVCGAFYYAACQVGAIAQLIASTMPDYRQCRDIAEELKPMEAQANRLEQLMAMMNEANAWMPFSMWPEDARLRYEAIWKEHDTLAKKHNELAEKYDELMRKHDMSFYDTSRLPPDAPETLPYYFYPIYRPKLTD